MTFPISYEDHPSSRNFPSDYHGDASFDPFVDTAVKHEVKNVDYTNYEEGIWVGYRYFDTKGAAVSYPFGYGLSYTTFEYSAPSAKYSSKNGLTATVTVKNTGKVAGKEVVEVYVNAPAGGLDKPAKELRAFGKTRLLAPGESQTLTFTVDPYYLASFNEGHEAWETVAGDYKVFFAASVSDVRQSASFRVPKTRSWEVHKVFPLQYEISEMKVTR
jgi:beta-glucosidase